jgi:D-2-hydroxyacid dehydrogenase (NADP+)
VNLILRLFIRVLYFFLHRKWRGKSFNILINETKPTRIKLLKEYISENVNAEHQILVQGNKLFYFALSREAHIIFSYGLSRYINTENLKLLYLGQVGSAAAFKNSHFKIVSAPNFVSDQIADYVLASVFAYEKKLLQNAQIGNNRLWNQAPYLDPQAKSLHKLKIGILGLGKAGSKIAVSFKRFGCEVYGFDKDIQKMKEFDNGISDVKWPGILSFVDYLIIAVSDAGNKNLIDRECFEKMNSNICLVNISRAIVVDESVMLEAVKGKKIRGAILDVFNEEPLKKNSEFYKFENIVTTPHIAGNIDLVFSRIAENFAIEINKTLDV